MWQNPQETANLVTFTEEILNGKLHFLCSITLHYDSLRWIRTPSPLFKFLKNMKRANGRASFSGSESHISKQRHRLK